MAEERKKWDPNRGTMAGLAAPTAVGLAAGIPTIAAISGFKKTKVNAADRPIIESITRTAKSVGVGVHEQNLGGKGSQASRYLNPLIPAYHWEHPKPIGKIKEGEGFLGKLRELNQFVKKTQRQQGIDQIKSMTGSGASKGIAMAKNIRPYMKPGVLAHETGHALQPKWLKGRAYRWGAKVPGLSALYVAGTPDEKNAQVGAVAGTIGAGGMLAAEVDASRRGAKLLKQAGMRGPRRLTAGIGLASYGAVAAAPLAAYAAKKSFGGYKPTRNKNLSSVLDDLITFEDPRPRNPLGEFQPQGEGGPSPNNMAMVYKQGHNAGIAQGGGAALVGGALGAVGASAGRQGYRALQRLVNKVGKRKIKL